MATYQNLFVDQGSNFSFEFDLKEAVSTDVIFSDLESIDLLMYTARGQIKRNYAASKSVSFTTSIDIDDKTIIVSLNAAETQAMKATRYVYDIQLVSDLDSTNVLRVFEGQLEVFPGVTTPIIIDDSPIDDSPIDDSPIDDSPIDDSPSLNSPA